jgi:multiple sugar transport system ATP-binding protein
VTHDQVEAMTLGHRVAVLKPVSAARPDNLQQVAPPAELFHNPDNLFVAGFIGSPAMNMVYGTLEGSGTDVYVNFAGSRVKVGPKALEKHPGLESRMGDQLVVGIRPGDFEAAAVAGRPADLTANVDVAEVLGSETFIHFELPSPPVVTPDIEELLADSGGDPSSLGDTTKFSARVSSDIPVHSMETLEVVIDTDKWHFFDPTSGLRVGR